MKKYLITISLACLLISCKKGFTVINEEFDDNHNNWHTIVDDTLIYDNVEKGNLVMQSKLGGGFNYNLIHLEGIYSPSLNHKINTKFKIFELYEMGGAGLVIGAKDVDKLEEFYFFGVTDKNEVIVSHESINKNASYVVYYQQKNEALREGKYNNFEFRSGKVEGNLSFYLNNKKIIDIPKKYVIGKCVGFFLLNGKMMVDDIKVEMVSF